MTALHTHLRNGTRAVLPFALAYGVLSVLSASPLRADTTAKRAGAPLILMSQSEIDALPSETQVTRGRAYVSPDGPKISIASPTHNGTYEGPFPIRVEFHPGPKGHEVDIDSLRLEYKKAWGIDITDRVREYITGTVIDVKASELPEGRHTVEIQISDVQHNLSREIFTVTIK